MQHMHIVKYAINLAQQCSILVLIKKPMKVAKREQKNWKYKI